MMAPSTHRVPAELSHETLSNCLQAWLPHLPAGDSIALIAGRRVQLNGNLCVDASRRLKAGDVVKVLPHAVAATPTAKDARLRFVDPHLVVVEKPAGMTTMRYGDEVSASGRRDRRPTLLDLLPRLVAEKESGAGCSGKLRPPKPPRGGRSRRTAPRAARILPVHRLDRDTSGLMVFARTPEAERALTAMFRGHDFERVYLAVAFGDVAGQTIESFLADDRGDGRRGSVDDPARGKRAVTHVRPIESLSKHTLVECRLETGRTHQIRIHLAERGHPLCGDRMYRAPLGQPPIPDKSAAPRLALHAAGLAFTHPVTGRGLSFRAPLPADLADLVARLRSK